MEDEDYQVYISNVSVAMEELAVETQEEREAMSRLERLVMTCRVESRPLTLRHARRTSQLSME